MSNDQHSKTAAGHASATGAAHGHGHDHGHDHGLSDADIRKVAKLSRLAIDDAHVASVRTQLSSILGHIAKLQALPTEGVEPMAHPMKIVNRLGADEPKACMPVEELLKNAPAVEDRFLAVPKVLGDGGGA